MVKLLRAQKLGEGLARDIVLELDLLDLNNAIRASYYLYADDNNNDVDKL